MSAIILGNVDIIEVTPLVELPVGRWGDRILLEGMRVKAGVKVSVTVGLWETELGDTVWTASADRKETVNQVRVLPGDKVVFDATDPLDAYRDLVRPMVKKISKDFKAKYKRIK